jgi:hypothetical protein
MKKEDRARKHTIWKVRSPRRTKKELGLENVLPEIWGLHDKLKKKEDRTRKYII